MPELTYDIPMDDDGRLLRVAAEVVRMHAAAQLADPRVHVLAMILRDDAGDVVVNTFERPTPALVQLFEQAAKGYLALLDAGERPCG